MISKPLILIADDNPLTAKTLSKRLEFEGLRVTIARDGRECLDLARSERPSLILLDVMMPGLDGLATLSELRKSTSLSRVPVIFITARAGREDRLSGLDLGAIDYLIKPIDYDETLAKIRTQLRLQSLYEENSNLSQRLAEARREASLSAFAKGVAHNLNNLLAVAQGYLELLEDASDDSESSTKTFKAINQALYRMKILVERIDGMTAEGVPDLFSVDIHHFLRQSVQRFQEELEVDEVFVNLDCHLPKDFLIQTNEESFEMILVRLLLNAWESYAGNTPSSERKIQLSADFLPDESKLKIKIRDWGGGLSKEIENNLFYPFVTTKSSLGRGLGLTIARHALKTFNADLKVYTAEDKGTVAEIRYPLR